MPAPRTRPGLAPPSFGARSRAGNDQTVVMGLSAAVVTVEGDTPLVLAVRRSEGGAEGGAAERGPGREEFGLPFGPFDPVLHRTLDIGLRTWVEEQTGLELGYVEQLYTFGDRGRAAEHPDAGQRVVSIGYLALTRSVPGDEVPRSVWRPWYHHFPWEDRRGAVPAMIADDIAPLLEAWARASRSPAQTQRRLDRARLCFALEGRGWDEEKVLERYELLYEAGLVEEALRDQAPLAPPLAVPVRGAALPLGVPMQFDHRRILATAMGRLRAKLKYRPIIFELMPEAFTLLALQRTVEAISGVRLHKQNFRRVVERGGLVERTGQHTHETGGRPAELFRFRREVLSERPAPGVKVSAPRLSRPGA